MIQNYYFFYFYRIKLICLLFSLANLSITIRDSVRVKTIRKDKYFEQKIQRFSEDRS